MSQEEKTGRTRFCVKRLGGPLSKRTYVVLQVEVRHLNTYYSCGQVESSWHTYWRDADQSDIHISIPNTEAKA